MSQVVLFLDFDGVLHPDGEAALVTDRHNRATDDRHIEATRTGL